MSEKQDPRALTRQNAGQRIREEREARGWSQRYVAEQLGADRYYLSRWKNGKMLPSPYYREKLCTLFGKNARELGFLAQEALLEVETLESERIAHVICFKHYNRKNRNIVSNVSFFMLPLFPLDSVLLE